MRKFSGCGPAAALPALMAAMAMAALVGPGWAEARMPDTLTVFRAGDTARASAVNANFQLLLERMKAMAEANERLAMKVDSLQKAGPPSPGRDSLEAAIAGMKAQIDLLDARMDSARAGQPHVHAVSQVTGLPDSLKAKVSAQGGPLKVCSGKTAPGIGWVDYSPYSVYLEIDTKACGFASVPQYFTSLGGGTRHFTTTGATSVYAATATGFRVYVASAPWSATPEIPPAETWGLHINWVAIGP